MSRFPAVLLVTVLLLAGCGGGDDSADTTLPPSGTTTTTTLVAGGGSDTTTTTSTTLPVTTTTTVAMAGGGPECLVGTWNPDQAQLEDFLLTLYRAYAADASLDAGTIDLVLGEDGSFAQVYNGIAGSGTAGDIPVTMEFSGGSFGTWEASGDTITISFEGSDIAVAVNGNAANAPSIPAGMVEAGYVCIGDELVVEPPPGAGGFWPLPQDWTRAG